MAKQIKSLTSKSAKTANDNVVDPNSRKGKELARRNERDANTSHKRPSLLSVKKTAGALTPCEVKTICPANQFAELTPRQAKRLEKRPAQLESLIASKVTMRDATQVAERIRIDEDRARRARVKARN